MTVFAVGVLSSPRHEGVREQGVSLFLVTFGVCEAVSSCVCVCLLVDVGSCVS